MKPNSFQMYSTDFTNEKVNVKLKIIAKTNFKPRGIVINIPITSNCCYILLIDYANIYILIRFHFIGMESKTSHTTHGMDGHSGNDMF